jgi:hypothetical protein
MAWDGIAEFVLSSAEGVAMTMLGLCKSPVPAQVSDRPIPPAPALAANDTPENGPVFGVK